MQEKLLNIEWSKPESRWAFIQAHEGYKRQYMTSLYRQWFIDICYYAGLQYVYDDGIRITQPKVPSWRVQSVSNLLMPQVRQLISNLARIEPIWSVLPATRSQEHIDIAQLNTDVLHSYWQQLKIYKQYLDVLFWTGTIGNGFLKTGWDPDLGTAIQVPTEEEELNELFRILGIDSKNRKLPDIKIGDLFIDVKSPFELIFPPGIQKIEEATYSIETCIRSTDYVMDKYDLDVSNETAQFKGGLFFFDKLNTLLGSTPNIGEKNQVIVYEVNVLPNRKLKNGLRFVMCQGKDCIKPIDYPYDPVNGVYHVPYLHFGEVKVPGQFWYTSTLHQNLRNQRFINRFDSQVIEYTELMLKGKWLKPKQSKISSLALTDAPGEVIEYNHPFIPQQARLISFPRSIFDIRSIVRNSMQDTASSHDPSQGKAVGSVRAASLAQELKEGDLAVLGPIQIQHDEELAKLGVMILTNAAKYVNEKRLVSVSRNGQLTISRDFTGKQLRGSNETLNYFNVITTHTGRAPWNRLVQEQKLTTLIQNGFLVPGRDDELVLRSVGLESAEPVFELPEKARALQNDENKKLDQGQPVMVAKHNHHKAHLAVMQLHLETPGFWENLSPEAQKVYQLHMDQHMQMDALLTILPSMLQAKMAGSLQAPLGMNKNANRIPVGG